jgi:hypothetical protein
VFVLVANACSSSEPQQPQSAEPSPAVAGEGAAQKAPAPSAPTEAVAPVRSDVPEKLEGYNRRMEGAKVNGLELGGLECNTKGGLLAGMQIARALAGQKQAFQGCATASELVRVHFVYDGTKNSDVRVAASSPAVARCVADAVTKTTFPDPSTCIISLKVGPPAPN